MTAAEAWSHTAGTAAGGLVSAAGASLLADPLRRPAADDDTARSKWACARVRLSVGECAREWPRNTIKGTDKFTQARVRAAEQRDRATQTSAHKRRRRRKHTVSYTEGQSETQT